MIERVEGRSEVRERLIRFGADRLSPKELLGLVLRERSREEEAVATADRALQAFGGLRSVASRTMTELMDVEGIGPARAARIKAAFGLAQALGEERLSLGEAIRSSSDVFLRFLPQLRDKKQEVFLSLLLDGKNRLIREIQISAGSLTAAIVHPREVFVPAIRESADAVVFVHNHPSGDPTPSREDLKITRRLVEAGRIVGIRVLDHIVIGENEYVSFHERGLIDDE